MKNSYSNIFPPSEKTLNKTIKLFNTCPGFGIKKEFPTLSAYICQIIRNIIIDAVDKK